ncbi:MULTISPECIES: flagellar filament capping protein FliD [Sphingobium]|uniref:Flagellar hook-associated protein 2 n=2 Tax=Sphingobium cupriresistens TaxID=1132417 RepID=A0A0J7Y130_9SPHN|nr:MULTISPECIES: flagellar filament capping protein FliD [Sphingobium]KMS57118.1 flagellar hook protein [Sphingobium cupriresistens LL01]RYM09796.1 flagellar hook protein [Sphingobium cupriresistens]WCP14122.1 Flagellar hook-associated protein 2 [Sphingobium sp. AntQ-1]
MTSVGSSILTALNAGSGIDTSALVTSLVSATREPKQTAITSQQSLNSSRISALASAISSLDTFADALTEVLSGADYTGAVASNDASIASVSLLSGGSPAGLPAQLTVDQLASARVYSTGATSGATGSTVIGTGSFTLTNAAGEDTVITLDSSNNSFAGLAAAINAANTGVTARVVIDTQGARLVFKGETGADNDFTISASADDSGSILGGMSFTSSSAPLNAKVTLDGVAYEYASNTIDDAIPYLRIDLNKASPGTTVTLSMSQPTAGLSDLLKEFVDAYNTLMKALNTATATGADSSSAGVLNGVAGVRDMKRQLAAITSTQLAATGTYKTLADIGVSTNRDGTLTLDTARLASAMEADPEGVTNMVNPKVSTTASPGLSALMDTVRDNIEQEDGPLKTAQARYDAQAEEFTKQLEDLDEKMTNYEEHLTKIYAAMETRLSALKATQSYLEQQIEVWNNSDS